jgi:pimeloyl-ACP methyl ester carboxylesterase
VAPDQRGYGQSDAPTDVEEYDQTHLVGDVVGLMKALGEESAILVGHDFGSWVGYYGLAMRPDRFRGLFMMCSPPSPRPAISPVEAVKSFPEDLVFYQEYLSRPGTADEIMQDIRGYLTGVYYSVSGACSDDEQWRAFWQKDTERFEDTYTVPTTLPPFMSQPAVDYVVSEFSRRGIQGALNWYTALDSTWRHTSFLDGVIVRQPAVFLTGDRDPSAKPLFGTNRQAEALASLPTTFPNLQEVITLKGVGHAPPDENPAEVNPALLRFLEGLKDV